MKMQALWFFGGMVAACVLAGRADAQTTEPTTAAPVAEAESPAEVSSTPVEAVPKVPQVPPTRVEGSRSPVKPTIPASTEKPLSEAEQQAKRLGEYLHKRGTLNQPLRLEEVSRGAKPPFLRRTTIIDPNGYWEREWVLGDRVIRGANGQLSGEQLHELADSMAKYDLSAQPRAAGAAEPRFARRVAYESVELQFGQDRWRTERLFAEPKLETDPLKASAQERILLVTEQVRNLTSLQRGQLHPIGNFNPLLDQTNSRRLFIPSGSRQLNGSP